MQNVSQAPFSETSPSVLPKQTKNAHKNKLLSRQEIFVCLIPESRVSAFKQSQMNSSLFSLLHFSSCNYLVVLSCFQTESVQCLARSTEMRVRELASVGKLSLGKNRTTRNSRVSIGDTKRALSCFDS